MNRFMKRVERLRGRIPEAPAYVEMLYESGRTETLESPDALSVAISAHVSGLGDKPVKIIGKDCELLNAILDSVTGNDLLDSFPEFKKDVNDPRNDPLTQSIYDFIISDSKVILEGSPITETDQKPPNNYPPENSAEFKALDPHYQSRIHEATRTSIHG